MWFRLEERKMNKFLDDRYFKKGLSVGFLISLLAQVIEYIYFYFVVNYTLPTHISVHYFWQIGFPFPIFYGWYGFFSGHFSLFGFIGNIIATVIFSIIVGFIFKLIWLKISSRRTELK